MTPENKVKTWLVNSIKKKYPEAWIYKPPGGAYGKKGVPDILLCVNGLFVGIEVKAKADLELSSMQLHQLSLIVDAGGVSASMKGKDIKKLDAIFKILDTKYRDCRDL